MSLTELQFPPIDAESAIAAAKTSASIAVVAPTPPDLSKIDLTDVALAMYGKWPDEVKAVKANLSTVVLDLSAAAKITEARSLRTRLILNPLAAARKVSAGIKSKMAATSKAVGAELEKIEAAYKEADALILPKIEAREAELEAEREEARKAEEARKEKHRTNLEAIRIYIDRASAPGMTAERIAKGIAQLEALPTPTKEAWEEFAVPAANAICETLDKMRALHAKALADEAAEAERVRRAAELAEQERRLAAERAEIERQRAELEAARALQAQQRMDASPAGPASDGSQKPGGDGADCPAKAGSDVTRSEDASRREAPPESAQDGGKECNGGHAEQRPPQAADAAPAVASVVTVHPSALTAAPPMVPSPGGVTLSVGAGPITMIEPATQADPRDALLREALALTKYAAAPFFGRFPTHPKTTPEWWAGLREQIEALQPKLIAHIEGLQ